MPIRSSGARHVAVFVALCATFPLLPSTAMAQDECASAVPIVDGINGPFNIAVATPSPGPMMNCGGMPNDLWFTYTATCCGNLTVDNCTPTFSMMNGLQIYDGAGGCGHLVSLGCTSMSCSYQSTLTVPVVQGQLLYVRVASDQYSYATGFFHLNVNCVPAAPGNDEVTGAIAISQGQNGPYRSFCATTSTPAWPCGNGADDVWFSFQAPSSGPFTFRTCTSDFDTTLQVFDGAGGPANLVSLGCNDNFCGYQSSVTATVTQGGTYYLRVGGANGSQGNIRLEAWPGDGTGTIVTGTPSCGATTINYGGLPRRGFTINIQVGNVIGPGVIGLGFGPFPTQTYCGCQFGHSWQALQLGTTLNFVIPNSAGLLGVMVGFQGADLGGTGGCVSPNFTLTRTHQIVIG